MSKVVKTYMQRTCMLLKLLLFAARFAHDRHSSRMLDRFLNWGDHGKPKSGKIRGRCQFPWL